MLKQRTKIKFLLPFQFIVIGCSFNFFLNLDANPLLVSKYVPQWMNQAAGIVFDSFNNPLVIIL